MKKIFTTILILLYFTATTEATVHLHFCMGEFKSMSLWHGKKAGEKCLVCGMVNKKGCCEDRHVVVKTEKKYNVPVVPDLVPKLIVQSVPFLYTIHQSIALTPAPVRYSSSGSPTAIKRIPLFIRNCTYRI